MLQHLLLDPTYGYLYPHRHAVAAFGLLNEYQLTKHRSRLAEGQHWHKIRGVDHVDRVFYSLPGLELLTQLIATPQAQAFWQLLSQQTQPGGELVQISPASLYTEPEPIPATAEPASLMSMTHALAQYLSPDIQRVVVLFDNVGQ